MRHDGVRIGLLEDDPIMGESLVRGLSLEGHSVRWWKRGEEAVRDLTSGQDDVDLVICDIRLPDMNGEDVFRQSSRISSTPFLFMSGYAEIDQAVRLMRSGAVDFITKPFEMGALLDRIANNAQAAKAGQGTLGVSPQMCRAETILHRYADHHLPVLIQGETGTGKEVCARLLHRTSERRDKPFVAVNCAAIPADLLESELFGHERGAFTGAHQQHRGYAERAGEGVLFLDEIGDMPANLQAKLLRLIEDGSFHRLGGEKPLTFRARIVCATHRDIISSAVSGFRQDLFYRLSALPLQLAPLRERPDDIVWLAQTFLEEIIAARDTCVRGIGAAAEEALIEHDWPGNARELRNRLERAIALSEGTLLVPADVFPDRAHVADHPATATLAEIRDAAEKRQIQRALNDCGGQVARAARALGISRTTLWEKMTRYGIAMT
ncbi:DNA-binding NtrC family response regulator [Shinella sp. BE166]|uniref:sigma-54-dependent transcriptional regulator n=1 Tax=Shinella sp. BE166 TaxID=3373918 RepID=UPI003EB6FE78